MTLIGWIGTGVMGAPMVGHLMDAGHELAVYNRTKSRTDELVERGARWLDSPAELAAACDVVVTMVGYPSDVRETILGDGGVLAAMKPGSLLIDMTTSEPSLAEEIFEAAGKAGVASLDAPVSGGDVGARDGTLVVMAGGTQEAFDRAEPILQAFARRVTLHGGPGAGQHTKAMNQIAVASTMIAVCEALLYGYRAGLDLEAALETIGGGAASSVPLKNLAPRMLVGDIEPGFKIDHFIKDLGIALAEAQRLGLDLPGTKMAEELYRRVRDEEALGQKGTHALIITLARMSGLDWLGRDGGGQSSSSSGG